MKVSLCLNRTMQSLNLSLQETFAANNACFGCGPSNQEGLRLRSFVAGTHLVATFQGQQKYEAFPGMLNGGIIGALLDCHCNWTGAWHLMQEQKLATPPCTVTGDYHIKLLRPTPSTVMLNLSAWVIEASERKTIVQGEIRASDIVCAICLGTFIAVKPGHPAYHRW